MESENFIKFVKSFIAFDYAKENDSKSVVSFYGNEGIDYDSKADRFRNNISRGIKEAKIFEIEDNIKKLLCLTDTPIDNESVKLPFPYIFIDVNFTKEELAEFGIEIKAKEIIGILAQSGILTNNEGKEFGSDLNLCTLSIQEDGWVWFDDFNKNFNISKEFKEWDIKVQEVPTTDKKARDFTHKFFLNFLNFLYNPEVEYIEHKRSEKNIERRIKRGLIPISSTLNIRVTGKLKLYIDEISNMNEFHYGYRFWVRGFFRTLKNDRYGENVGKKIFIPPFIKGKGVLIDKHYFVTK